MVRTDDIRRTPFVKTYTFATGGEDDLLQLDFVRDRGQGLGTPARSLVIRNSGAGTVYFLFSEDGQHWSEMGTIPSGAYESYAFHDGILISILKVWASAAATSVDIRATPGMLELTIEDVTRIMKTLAEEE